MPKESRASKIITFDEGRFWFHKKAGLITIGITQECLDDIGTIENISLPAEGDDFDKEEVVCDVEGSDDSVGVPTPAAGFVSEVNLTLEDDVAIINEDPIDEGWLVKIEYQDESDLVEYQKED